MLHFSSLLGTLLYIGAPLSIYYSLGYIALNRIIKTRLRHYGTFISLPIYLAAGVILLTFVLYPIGLLIFNSLIVYLTVIAILLCALGNTLLSKKRPNAANEESLPDKPSEAHRKKLDDLAAGIVFAVSLLYIAVFMAKAEWPPAGDLINHGLYTSMIIYDQRIPATFYPFRDAAFRYPLGFHINAAFLALCLGIYPGESVFLFGGVLMIILIPLVFTLTYVMTRSRMLAVLSSLLMYLVNTSGNLMQWVFGNLFNGTYPNIYGSVAIFFSIVAVAIYAEVKDRYILLRLFPILMVALLFTYPSFIILPIILFAIVAFHTGIRKLINQCMETRRDIIITIFLAMSFILTCFYVYLHVFLVHVEAGGIRSVWYSPSQEILVNSLFGLSMLVALVFSTFLILFSFIKAKKPSIFQQQSRDLAKLRPILMTYVLIEVTLILSLNSYFYGFAQYFLPSRLELLVMMFSVVVNIYALIKIVDIAMEKLWNSVAMKNFAAAKKNVIRRLMIALGLLGTLVILLPQIPDLYELPEYASSDWLSMFILVLTLVLNVYAIKKILDIILQKLSNSALKKKLPVNKRNMLVGLTIFLFFNANGLLVYSLSMHASLRLTSYAWTPTLSSFSNDYSAFEWIQNNVKNGELILNDFSWSGLWLLSFSIKNVSMTYLLATLNRTHELQDIWLQPENATLVHSLLKKYNVSYILVTSELGFYDYLVNSRYKPKPHLPTEYDLMFYAYDFLEPVFRSGSSAIFRVR
jgi:hypothetical protein